MINLKEVIGSKAVDFINGKKPAAFACDLLKSLLGILQKINQFQTFFFQNFARQNKSERNKVKTETD